MTVGDRIKNYRVQAGMTQEDVANIVHTTKQTIHKYEMGIVTNIPLDKLEDIATALNVTPALLMGWDDNKLATHEWDDEQSKENIELFKSLPQAQKDEALRYLRYLASIKEDR